MAGWAWNVRSPAAKDGCHGRQEARAREYSTLTEEDRDKKKAVGNWMSSPRTPGDGQGGGVTDGSKSNFDFEGATDVSGSSESETSTEEVAAGNVLGPIAEEQAVGQDDEAPGAEAATVLVGEAPERPDLRMGAEAQGRASLLETSRGRRALDASLRELVQGAPAVVGGGPIGVCAIVNPPYEGIAAIDKALGVGAGTIMCVGVGTDGTGRDMTAVVCTGTLCIGAAFGVGTPVAATVPAAPPRYCCSACRRSPPSAAQTPPAGSLATPCSQLDTLGQPHLTYVAPVPCLPPSAEDPGMPVGACSKPASIPAPAIPRSDSRSTRESHPTVPARYLPSKWYSRGPTVQQGGGTSLPPPTAGGTGQVPHTSSAAAQAYQAASTAWPVSQPVVSAQPTVATLPTQSAPAPGNVNPSAEAYLGSLLRQALQQYLGGAAGTVAATGVPTPNAAPMQSVPVQTTAVMSRPVPSVPTPTHMMVPAPTPSALSMAAIPS
ncbi:hypothetical protein PHYSODRAFT_329355, partial [Phytophthora sojae]